MVEPAKPAFASAPQPEPLAKAREPGLLAGLDEAGLGPILGPLVVAGVAFSGPRGADPWTLLAPLVSRDRQEPGKLRVADSKRVNQGKYGLKKLERSFLAFWTVLHGSLPQSLRQLLLDGGTDLDRLPRCPWYGDLELPLPLCNDAGELELLAHGLERLMQARDIHLLHLALRPVDVEEFNQLILETDNKSEAHFRVYSEVIGRLLRVLPNRAHLVADRCGGRMHYLQTLRRNLRGRRIRMLREEPGLSSYEIQGEVEGGRGAGVRISFAARGEDRAFPTALASCAAKYVRELMMELLNRWFLEARPGLKRTAGYYQDGQRFLAEVKDLISAPDFPRHRLIRCR